MVLEPHEPTLQSAARIQNMAAGRGLLINLDYIDIEDEVPPPSLLGNWFDLPSILSLSKGREVRGGYLKDVFFILDSLPIKADKPGSFADQSFGFGHPKHQGNSEINNAVQAQRYNGQGNRMA